MNQPIKTIIVFHEARIFWPCFGLRKFYPCWTEYPDVECIYTYKGLEDNTRAIVKRSFFGYDIVNG